MATKKALPVPVSAHMLLLSLTCHLTLAAVCIPYLPAQGLVRPELEEGTQASVFAVYDEKQHLQYVGFSRDLRNSLRTVLGRRPDKAYYYK